MKTLRTEIDIEAPAERVWDALTSFSDYPTWNPFMPHLAGTPLPGERLDVTLEPPGGNPMRFQATVLAAERNSELRWIGRFVVPGLFDGEHKFEIHPLGAGRVRFVQQERFTGLLVPFFASNLDAHTLPGFMAMNAALKARVEATVAGQTLVLP